MYANYQREMIEEIMFDGCSPLKASEKAEKFTTMREKWAWRKFWLFCDSENKFLLEIFEMVTENLK